MPQADLGSVAFIAQRFLIQSPMNGYGKVTNMIHFYAVVSSSGNELRNSLTLQGTTNKDEWDLALRQVQELECLRFPPMGAGVLGDNKVIGVRAQPFAKLLGSCNCLCTDREMHFVELSQAVLYFRGLTMKKENVQRRMPAF